MKRVPAIFDFDRFFKTTARLLTFTFTRKRLNNSLFTTGCELIASPLTTYLYIPSLPRLLSLFIHTFLHSTTFRNFSAIHAHPQLLFSTLYYFSLHSTAIQTPSNTMSTAKPQAVSFTAREMETLALAWQCFFEDPKVRLLPPPTTARPHNHISYHPTSHNPNMIHYSSTTLMSPAL